MRMLRHVFTILLLSTAAPLTGQAEFAVALESASAGDSAAAPSATTVAQPVTALAPSQPWSGWAQATGTWGGLRPLLSSVGLEVEALYLYDVSGVTGGLRRDLIGRGLLSAGLTADLATTVGLTGATLHAGILSHAGPDGSALTGDIQAYSNIDAERFTHLAEAWYEQRLGGDRVRVKAGQVDANSEFAVVEPATEFINASAGFSPTMYGLPTYPEPVPSLNLFVRPAGWLTLGAGVYRGPLARAARAGAPGGAAFAIGEGAVSWTGGRIAAGYWRHPGAYAPLFAGGFQRAPQGWYASLEQRLTQRPDGPEGEDAAPGLTLFAKYGRADDRISEFGQHLMVGVVREAPFGRASDATGLMVSHVDLSDAAAAGFAGNETAIEVFYRTPLLGFLAARPDLQLVLQPAGDPTTPAALAATVRVELTF